jgi:hypothetical protein
VRGRAAEPNPPQTRLCIVRGPMQCDNRPL